MSYTAYSRHSATKSTIAVRAVPGTWRDLARDWQRWSPVERFTAMMLGAGVVTIVPLFIAAAMQAIRL